MNSAQETYKNLLALSKKYLLQEYALTDRILSDGDTYQYFVTLSQQQRRLKQEEQQRPPMPQKKEQSGQSKQEQPSQSPVSQPKPLPSAAFCSASPVSVAITPTANPPPLISPVILQNRLPLSPIATPSEANPSPSDEKPKPSAPAISTSSASPSTPPATSPASTVKTRLQLEPSPVTPFPSFEGLRKIIQEFSISDGR